MLQCVHLEFFNSVRHLHSWYENHNLLFRDVTIFGIYSVKLNVNNRYVLMNKFLGSLCSSGYHTLTLKHFQNRYKGVSKSFRTGHLEQELQMVQLSATRCSCITIL